MIHLMKIRFKISRLLSEILDHYCEQIILSITHLYNHQIFQMKMLTCSYYDACMCNNYFTSYKISLQSSDNFDMIGNFEAIKELCKLVTRIISY